jgi:hypothetical protein
MTGFDWGAYSVAMGLYYPIVGILADELFREVVSTRPSLAYRVLHTTETTHFRVLYSRTGLGSTTPSSDDIRIVVANDMREPSTISPASHAVQAALQRFSLDSRFIRVGLDVELRNELEVGIDQVRFWGDYREAFSGLDYRLSFDHYITSVHAFQRFGDFVALRGYLNYFGRYYERTANGDHRSPEARDFSLGVAIEFVL